MPGEDDRGAALRYPLGIHRMMCVATAQVSPFWFVTVTSASVRIFSASADAIV